MSNDNIIKNIQKEMEKEIDDECIIIDSIIELIQNKNKEIEQLKSYSIYKNIILLFIKNISF